jgi:hypothetical protein
MDATIIAQVEGLRLVEQRLRQAGLVVELGALSPAHRRAAYALRRSEAARAERLGPEQPAPARGPIGFSYPNAR